VGFGRRPGTTAVIWSLQMSSAAKALPAVLERIDADLDKSVERLFDLVRIPSISTDSAYKDFCRTAANSLAKDL